MITIYKYELSLADNQKVNMYEDSEILSGQIQNGNLCIWARVDTDKMKSEKKISTRGTGHDCEGLGKFIGTFQTGGLVFHLFESGDK